MKTSNQFESRIVSFIKYILFDKIRINKNEFDEKSNFLGRKNNLNGIDLVYLLISLEKEFGIVFLEEDLLCDQIYTLPTLVDLVSEKISLCDKFC